MTSASSFSRVPVIDIAGLGAGDAARDQAIAQELGKAAREVGFLYVTGHGVPDALLVDLRQAAERLFALPLERKMDVYIGKSKNHRGSVPEGEDGLATSTRDKQEAFDLAIDLPADDPDYCAGNPMLGPNQWPDLPGFREPVQAYYDAAFAVGRRLMRGFAIALGEPPDVFERYVTRPPSQLRLIHYPYAPDAIDAMGIGAHTDYECFTLLHSTVPGLEVLNGDGVWIDAPPIPGAFVVNIGDMLELWTNGTFIATSHRVRKVKEERYSFPLFFAVDYHTKVAPLPRFVTAERPAQPGLIAGEHHYAQTIQVFRYLKDRLARGEITLPDNALALSSFGQEARHHRG